MTLQIAIIGAGPAGCYCAERLLREAPGCRIDIIDRLPTPFGLVRAGVAPDHQTTKAVARILERALSRDGVAFYGNVAIGRDASLDELRQLYGAVVIATGAPEDRRLGIPGEALPGIVGSAAFTRWYNSHPDDATSAPPLAGIRSAVIIGIGNVALDVARILAKTPAELAESDIAPAVERALAATALSEIHICGRRGPETAGFALQELGELGALTRAQPFVDPDDLPPPAAAPNSAVIEMLRGFAAAPAAGKPIAIRFHFNARPAEFAGEECVREARFTRLAGGDLVLPADLVIPCIGYRALACGALSPEGGIFTNEAGRIAPGLYVVGWAKRGSSGTIATNRAEGHAVAQRLVAETPPAGRPGGTALTALLARRGVAVTDFARWQRIDAAERAAAAPGKPRAKLTDIAAMLAC